MNCELSIIVPVYNTAQYLPQCIESILKQSFKNWELILIDDGSTDGSAEICEEWAQKDARIKVIHKVNSGQADCRNQALEICQGVYIGFVDSDDWIEESMYEVLMDDLKTTNSDIAICNHYDESKNKTLCKNVSDKRYILKNQEIQELVIKDKIKSYIWQMLFKRELLNEPMPTSKNYEDYSILPHWFENAKQVVYTYQPLYHYRLRKSSIVHDLSLNRYYEFFQAEISRYNYYKRSPLRKIAKRMVVKRGIKAAKYVSRNQTSLSKQKEIRVMVNKISKDLKAFSLIGIEKKSFKERVLLYLLLKHPNKFILYQRMMDKLMFYKHSNLDLYE
ncbi:glycosyltransferase family 2 protein [Segatella hominis]|uniref:glycosyltransferase family 2 protein n=1 Tax=Segatella hominis TaxID=2518605 RepID=UPI001C48AB13|nr:glycosyltransferase family 2 protein [Segatella hominis]WOZ80658.1 glycosyltransferase family 2 protein [Segatella hominis]